VSAQELSAEERAIVDEWHRQIAATEPLPPNIGSLGTVAALASGAALLALWRYSHLSLLLAVPLGILFLAGAVVHLFGGSGGSNVLRGRVQVALAALEAGGDEASRRAAAVAIIANAWDLRGPAAYMVLDVPEIEARLGAALETVRAVERVLCAARLTPAVLTAPSPPKG